MKKKVIIALIAVLVVGWMGFQLYHNKTKIDQEKKTNLSKELKVSVSTTAAFKKNMDKNISLVGNAVSNQETQIFSQVSGNIVSIHLNLGDYKSKGSILAQVDSKIKALALESAEINYNKLKDDYKKYQNLYKGGAASETQFRDIKIAYENAKIQVEQAKKTLSDTRIKAPFSGYITSKSVELGTFLNVGNPVATIVDISKLKVSVNVSEKDAYALKIGKEATISTSLYPNVKYTGKVTFISPKADNAHTYQIEISIVNQSKYPLKAGTFVSVNIMLKNPRIPLLIPRSALIGSIKDAQVYVVNNNVAHLRNIRIGQDYNDFLEVTQGLQEGEQVVTGGQVNLSDNMTVEVVNK